MNILNKSIFSNWVDTVQIPQIISNLTYDYYETNNPFRYKIEEEQQQIEDKDALKQVANVSTLVGAELFSVFTNPYYLTHKIVQIPSMYRSVVDVYKKYSDTQNEQE